MTVCVEQCACCDNILHFPGPVPGSALAEAFVCSGLGWPTGTQPGRDWGWTFLEEAVLAVQGVGYSALPGCSRYLISEVQKASASKLII